MVRDGGVLDVAPVDHLHAVRRVSALARGPAVLGALVWLVLSGCGPKGGPVARPVAAPAVTPGPPATPTAVIRVSPLRPVSVRSASGGPTFVFHPLQSTTLALHLVFPGGRIAGSGSGEADRQLQRLVGDLGLQEALEDLGGRVQAGVALRWSEVGIELPPEALDAALERLSAALASTAAPGPVAESPQSVALEDAVDRGPLRHVVEGLLLDVLLGRGSAVGGSARGLSQSLQSGVSPEGAVVTLVGPLDEAVLERVAARLSPWEQVAAANPFRVREMALKTPQQRVIWVVREEPPTAGILAWLVPRRPSSETPEVAWDVLAAWLGRGPGAPLQALTDAGGAPVAQAFFWDTGETCVFGVYFEAAPGAAPRVEQLVLASLAGAAGGSIPREGMERACWALRVDFQLETGTPLGMACRLGRAQFIGSAEDAVDELDRLGAIRADDLQRAAALLRPERVIAVGRGTAEEARSLAELTREPTPAPLAAPMPEPTRRSGELAAPVATPAGVLP
jgi:peptidase M16-like protein